MKQSTIKQINEHLEKARKKHPEFAPGGPIQVVSLSAEELGEMAQAVNDYRAADLEGYLKKKALSDKIKSEALDLIAVLIRFIEGD